MSVSDQHVCRSFGYVQIRWKVKHFWLWSCIQNWEVRSPEFDVQRTRWRLLLSIQEHSRHLHVCLHRLPSDNGPDVVRVHWKVRMCNCMRRNSCCCQLLRENEQTFRRGDQRPGPLIEDMTCLSNHLKPFGPDTLVIECKLVVDNPEMSPKKWSLEADNKGLRSLSDDLSDLFRKGHFSDMVIKIVGVEVPAVKAILYSRNKILAEYIARDISTKVIELPDNYECPDDSDCRISPEVNADAVWQLIGYLHHGRLEEIIFHPSVSVAECARILNVQEVRAHYIPDELPLTSELDVEEHVVEHTWFVTDFKEGNVRPIVSPTLIHNSSEEGGTAWRLVLYPRGKEGKGNHVAIYAEASGGDQARSKLACMEFALADWEQNYRFYRRVQKPPGETFEGLGVDDFLECPLGWKDGTLRVVFRLRISDGAAWVSKVHYQASVAALPRRLQHLQRLSDDLKSLLYKTARFPEFKVRCSGGLYPVHRSIMAARARSFSALVGESDELDLRHMDVTEDAMSTLLLYIYSGQLQAVDKDLVPKLLMLADYFGVDALYRTCSRIVENREEFVPRNLPSYQEE